MKHLEGVIFDMDGLMFNTEALYAEVADELLKRRGKQITTELLDQMMGRPGAISLQIMIDWHQLNTTPEQLQEETKAIFPTILDRALQPMPGLLELLDQLEEAQIPKAIATSSRRSFAEDVLGRFRLVPRFQFVMTCEEVCQGKPHPEMYLSAAARLNLPSPRILVLEDSQNGCQAAVVAGTYAVAVPGEHSRNHDFTGARFVAHSLHDIRIKQALGIY